MQDKQEIVVFKYLNTLFISCKQIVFVKFKLTIKSC